MPPRRRRPVSRFGLFRFGAVLFVVGSLYLLFRFPSARYLPQALPYLKEPKSLVVPVEGLSPEKAVSTWHAPRSGGRKHEGADLFAPRGTAVLSATRGTVWKVGWDRLGGNVVWVLGEGPALYYYAHLASFEPGLRKGDALRPGAVLGRVGNTGNAIRTPPHLHFGVYSIRWTGVYAQDPIPLLAKKGVFMPAPVPLEEPVISAEPAASPEKATAPKVRTAAARAAPKKKTRDAGQ